MSLRQVKKLSKPKEKYKIIRKSTHRGQTALDFDLEGTPRGNCTGWENLIFWFAILIFWVKWVGALELLTSSMTYHNYWIASWIFSFSQQAWGRRSRQSGQGKSCSDRCQGGKTQLTRNFWRFGAFSKIFGTRQLLKMAAIPIQPGQRGMAGGLSLSHFKI